ncbi:tRNA splicing endonuclease subunit 54 [Ptiloglossa arizonensis]|uniref:tRNA splicing endonuclease subunit 54 n=1 Tax=Ptiloglossa arizonensis TaxID=3350558 RepID=UPI003FA11DEA
MTEEKKKLLTNVLTAEELLQHKGIKYNAWDEYERSVKTLPKTGRKQFEPDDSWLQNMQIEKGIKARKNLIAVERVDRISQLASAEWLPLEKKARVKKYSGQDWSNFGLEKSGAFYLMPEEALFLLEANCLELTWNDVPLSIQQAYELLIDNVECSLEEYRVYSQLVRYGYRIQRFVYDSEKNIKNDESVNIKRKVIVEPEKGLWMTDIQQQTKSCTDTHNGKHSDGQENIHLDSNDAHVEICQGVANDGDISKDVYKIVDDLLCIIEDMEIQHVNVECKDDAENCMKVDNNLQTEKVNQGKRKGKSKVEIISEETLLGNIKIVTEPMNNCIKRNNSMTDWRSSRIQRNVKLLPKRSDKVPLSTDIAIPDSNIKSAEHSLNKHKPSSPSRDESQSKKSKHEVIELSDDEIQEVPQPMTRMDMLNLIPNIASQSTITVNISRGYIPPSIKPHKTVYHYENAQLRNLQQRDRRSRPDKNLENSNNNVKQNTLQCNSTSINNTTRRNTHVATYNQNLATNIHNVFTQDYFSMDRGQYTNLNTHLMYYNNRMRFAYSQNSYWHHRNTMFQNVFVALENYRAAIHQNRFLSVQMNNFSVPNVSNNTIRSFFSQNQSYHNFHQNSLPPRKFYHQRIVENTSIHCSVARNISLLEPRQRCYPRNHGRNSNTLLHSNDEVYQSSFKILPGVSSWSQLKTKWREEKTITIDDEDIQNDEIEDCDEVQVVGQLRSPLIGPKNASHLEEIFSKLKIIKSAPEKTVRRKKSKFKISYNVYSNTQTYRKANPGSPLYRVVIIRQDDPFLQPIELHRLLQDANNSPIVLACVSMSISYIQPGFVFIPNLT